MSDDLHANGISNSAPPSGELVSAVLKWSVAERLDLVILLIDSLRTGFPSFKEAEGRGLEHMRGRIEKSSETTDGTKERETILDEIQTRLEQVDRERIRTRIERARNGQDPTFNAFEVVEELRKQLSELRPA